ncbi:glycosyltransferase [Candidatus Fermentibacteria bacterium]|nr:glycosyltransferase [Candidatus Fermentibacteria bacterium]
MDNTSRPDVSVVVPAYNESESLSELLRETAAALSEHSYEVIAVDDGSTDDTWKVLRGLSDEYPLICLRFGTNKGKAAALSAGFARARGKLIATIDADLQDDPAEIPRLIRHLRENDLDLVSGWKKKRRDPVTKKVPSRLFNLAVRLTTRIRLHDFNCGLKVYRAKAAKTLRLFGEMHRYTPVITYQNGFAVGEKAVNHRPRKYGQTKYGVSRFFRGYADLLTVLFLHRYSVRPLHLFGGVGTVLSVAGFGILLYLTILWFGGEGIGDRPLLLLGVLLLIVGLQFVSLGLLGEMVVRMKDKSAPLVRETHPPERE